MEAEGEMDRHVAPLTAQQHGQQDGGEGRTGRSAALGHGRAGALMSVHPRAHRAFLWLDAWGRCIAPLPFPTSRTRAMMGRQWGWREGAA